LEQSLSVNDEGKKLIPRLKVFHEYFQSN
jgi:hypothetical protein